MSTITNTKKITNNKPSVYVHIVIMFCIMFGFRYITPPEPLTEVGIQVLGVFFAMLYGWLTIDTLWTTLLGIVALGLTDYTNVNGSFASAMGNSTVITLTLFCIITAILSHAGIAQFLAYKIVSIKAISGKPIATTLAMFGVIMILDCMLSATASLMLFCALLKEVSLLLGFKPGDKWPMLMMISAHVVGTIASGLLPFRYGPSLTLGTYSALTGDVMNGGLYMLLHALVLIGTLACHIFFILYIAKADVTPIRENKAVLDDRAGNLTVQQKYLLISFVALIVLIMLPDFLGAESTLKAILSGLGTNGWLAVYIAAYIAINFRDGISFKGMMTHDIIPWSGIYLVAGALAIANAFKDESTGITAWISATCGPILAGKSVAVIIIMMMLMSSLMTNVANNMATASIFSTLSYSLVISSGADICMPAVYLVVMHCYSQGIMTPAGSATAAYLFGEKKWIPGNAMVKYGAIYLIINYVLAFFISFVLGSVVFSL